MSVHAAHVQDALTRLFDKDQVITDPVQLIAYELDAGFDRASPDALVFPHTTDDVVRLAQWSAEYGIPLTARGAGTGLAGGAVAMQGGVIVNFAQMKQIGNVDAQTLCASVEPGVVNLAFDKHLAARGLYYPPDPASQRASTIGGNVATNAGGPHCFKYGVTTNYVTGMDVVLADGRRMRLGGNVVDAPEYDLYGLVCGSEGTLALVTDIEVKLLRRPPAHKTMTVTFDSIAAAGSAVSAVIAAGLVPATLEMMDQQLMRIVEPFAHAGLPVDAGAILLIEVDGYEAGLDAQIERITEIVRRHGGYDFRIAQDEQERATLWKARKSIAGAFARLAPSYYLVDITVPRSRLAETLADIDDVMTRYGLRVGHVLHAGDGNLHPLILITNPDDEDHVAAVHRAGKEVAELCVQKDGSLSGEHGIGTEKRKFMPAMFNEAELAAMWDVKQAFDPNNRLNPGKIYPDEMPAAPQLPAETPAPKHQYVPESAEEAAAHLAVCSAAGRSVFVGENVPVNDSSSIMSTVALAGIRAYAPDDLYVTVGAGTPLSDVQAFLADDGMRVPLAAPWTGATIGGLVAANVNAPLRLRYGALRDIVLCATVALADGRVIRSGRPLVKNVAGYDLTKVFIGSYGTLGLLTDVTLKIVPAPQIQRTIVVPVQECARGIEWAQTLAQQTLLASAVVLCAGHDALDTPDSPYILAYTAEGWSDDVDAELAQVQQVLVDAGAPTPTEIDISGTTMWREVLQMEATGTVQVRAGVPPALLADYARASAAPLEMGDTVFDVPHGLVYAVARHGDASAARSWVHMLRRPALERDGYTVVLDAPAAWLPALDRWGYESDALDLMRELKERWDPAGILNPGYMWRDR